MGAFSRPAFAFLLLALLLALGAGAACAATPGEEPFAPGELLRFGLFWEVVPAGEATMEVLPMAEVDGKRAWHFRTTARTNAFVDLFFTVRDRIDAFAQEDLGQSLKYVKDQHEGSYHRDVTVEFDWDRLQVLRTSSGEAKEPLRVHPGAFDPLTLFFHFRRLRLDVGESFLAQVTDGKKYVLARADIIARERVKVPAGEFDAYVVSPELKHVGGVFRKSPGAAVRIWITADRRRMPVKVQSKVAVGSFTAELLEAVRPD